MNDARLGSAASCRVLYEWLAGRVCGYLRAHGALDPEDLTSEVFLRVFHGIESFDGTESQFRAWVFTITHRLLIDERRRAAARPTTVELTNDALLVATSAESEALANLGDDWLRARLDELPPDQRAVLALRMLGDLTIDQVARILGKRRGAVKALQRRGLTSIRRKVDPRLA